MFGRSLIILSALCLSFPAAAESLEGGSTHSVSPGDPANAGSYGDRNSGGPYGFYSYPRHLHVDGGTAGPSLSTSGSAGASPYYDRSHGSAYYGLNYGAPYFGGGYYDGGIYYRERRD